MKLVRLLSGNEGASVARTGQLDIAQWGRRNAYKLFTFPRVYHGDQLIMYFTLELSSFVRIRSPRARNDSAG